MPSVQSRNFTFTVYPKDGEWGPSPKDWVGVQYQIFQLEVCPRTGRDHFQGVMIMDKKCTLISLKKLHGWAHFEACVKSVACNVNYCSKSRTKKPGPNSGPWTRGVLSRQGERTDLESYRAAIVEGASERDLAVSEQHFKTWVARPHC